MLNVNYIIILIIILLLGHFVLGELHNWGKTQKQVPYYNIKAKHIYKIVDGQPDIKTEYGYSTSVEWPIPKTM